MIAMKTKVTLFVTAAISAIVGAAIAIGISDSEAQAPPAGAKQFQFVVTGTAQPIQGEKVERYEDLEYGIVCYWFGAGFSCAKK
jgi:hypothetical protein